jgi:hypothetical protein
MEKINLNNYPVWITDYNDGTLPGDRMDELFNFLSEHPELMEEFEQYDHVTLHPDLSDRHNKKALQREFSELTPIQQEELTAALAEGDLTDQEAEEMMRHIKASPHLTELYNSLKDIRLIPDNISYPYKRSLKRYPLKPQFKRAMVTLLTAAASIAILFSVSILLDRNNPLSVPFTGSAEIDPVIITDREHNTGNSTAENSQAVTEDTRSSENPERIIIDPGEEGKSGETENGTAENSSRLVSISEEEKISSEGGSRNETSDLLAAGLETTTTINESNPAQKTGITSQVNNSAEGEGGDQRIVSAQQRDSFDLPYIKQPATPTVKEVNNTPERLAEMTPIALTDVSNPGSPREFIAKSFRQLILNDQNATTERVKPIELADATVTGINKLLGWEMKLEKKSDESGTLNSISFASQLIKFDHNIKNSSN